MTQPKISIIVPVYKAEKYLHKCLDSIKQQTFTDWECILVDDGSPDSSGKICDDYVYKDSRFRVIHKKNGGVSYARNSGLDNACGEYICFVDSDDYIETDYLSNFGCDSNMDLYVQGAFFVTEERQRKVKLEQTNLFELPDIAAKVTSIMPYSPKGFVLRAPWSKLYKSCLVGNLRFDTTVSFSEDYIFNVSFYKKINSLSISAGCGYYYMQDNSYLSRKKFDVEVYLNWFDKVQKSVYDLSIAWNYLALYREVSNKRVNWLATQIFAHKYTISDKKTIANYIKHYYADDRNRDIVRGQFTKYILSVPFNALTFFFYKLYYRFINIF